MFNWDSLNENEWNEALAKYYSFLTTPEMICRDARIVATNFYTISYFSTKEFYRYLYDEFFVWKYPTKNKIVTARISLEGMKMEELEVLKNKITNPNLSDIELYESALKINGLGCAGATALLATMYPNRFGTVDHHIVEALQNAKSLKGDVMLQRINPSNIKKADVLYILALLGMKAAELNKLFKKNTWTPRMINKAVWAGGKE